MDLRKLTSLALTYPEVGATRGTLPAGYHHIDVSAHIGAGRERFEQAGDAVLRWGVQRGAGLSVHASSPIAVPDAVVVVGLGLLRAPCRVVYVVDEADRRGFGYGTLPGHPESGEEFFSVRHDPDSDAVYCEIRAFSKPATWWARLGRPVTMLAQRVVTRRYLRAV